MGCNFWAEETFATLEQAQDAVTVWCAGRAGMRIHGSTRARPAELFAGAEAPVLLPVPAEYDVPVFTRVKVHRDLQVEVAKALYSVPGDYLGRDLDARADHALVKLYDSGRLVRIHPRQAPGGRSTDPADIPTGKAGYALRDLDLLVATAASHGPSIGVYAAQILDDPRPWARMRAVYRLLGLVRRYGADPVETACARALELDVVSVMKISRCCNARRRTRSRCCPAAPIPTAPGSPEPQPNTPPGDGPAWPVQGPVSPHRGPPRPLNGPSPRPVPRPVPAPRPAARP